MAKSARHGLHLLHKTTLIDAEGHATGSWRLGSPPSFRHQENALNVEFSVPWPLAYFLETITHGVANSCSSVGDICDVLATNLSACHLSWLDFQEVHRHICIFQHTGPGI